MKKSCCLLLLLGWAAFSCDSEHNVHDAATDDAPDVIDAELDVTLEEADTPVETDDGQADPVEEELPPAGESCGEAGVTVAGTLLFDGEFPAASQLWMAWQLDPPTIPQCMLEIVPVAFPAPFLFTEVPDSGWHIEVVLDVSGGFPPIPAEGDFVATVPAPELDLSADISGLEITLQPYVP